MGHFQQQTLSLPDGNDFDAEERWEMWSLRKMAAISVRISVKPSDRKWSTRASPSQITNLQGCTYSTLDIWIGPISYPHCFPISYPIFFWLYHNISHISYDNIPYIHICIYIYIYILFIYSYTCIYPMKIPYPILYLYHDKLLPLFNGVIRILLWPIF